MRRDVIRDIDLVLTVFDRNRSAPHSPHPSLRQLSTSAERSCAAPFRATHDSSCLQKQPSVRSMTGCRFESRQRMPVLLPNTQRQHFRTVSRQRFHHRVARNRPLFRCELHALPLHQPFRQVLQLRILSHGRRSFVIPVHVLPMMPRPPSARISSHPRPFRAPGHVIPVIPR